MNDLIYVFEKIKKMYQERNMDFPRVDEIILGYRWNIVSVEEKFISLAFKQGEEIENPCDLSKYIGLKADEFLKEMFLKDTTYRGVVIATLNVLSKPFNTKEELLKRNIIRSEGLNFEYDVTGKKVGLVGFGVYTKFFLNKCAEFHAFDFNNNIISKRISDKLDIYPKNIIWHLGENALNNKDVLKDLDIIIMTGTTIVNNTYLEILKACSNASIKGIYGPSCEMVPEYFFEKGYNYIFSTSIKNKEEYLKDSLSVSKNFSEFDHMNLYELKKM